MQEWKQGGENAMIVLQTMAVCLRTVMVKEIESVMNLSLCSVFKAMSIGFANGLSVAGKKESLRMIPRF